MFISKDHSLRLAETKWNKYTIDVIQLTNSYVKVEANSKTQWFTAVITINWIKNIDCNRHSNRFCKDRTNDFYIPVDDNLQFVAFWIFVR